MNIPGFTAKELERNFQIAQEQSGFFSANIFQVPNGHTYLKGQAISFHPWHPGKPCPCGSESAFEDCCAPFGVNRIFVRDVDGDGFSIALTYAETWQPWTHQGAIRKALQDRDDFSQAEGSPEPSFWNYLGEKVVLFQSYRMSFGTVEMTDDFLKIEALSRSRYLSLRRTLEKALGKELPPGLLSTQLLGPTSKEVTPLSSAGVPILEDYRKVRERQQQLFSSARDELFRDEIRQAAKALKILGPDGVVIFEDEAESDLLIDYALFEVKRHGKSIIQHFMRNRPPMEEIDAHIYRSFEQSFVSVFQIKEIGSDAILIQDLMDPGNNEMYLADFGLMATGWPGLIVYARALPLQRYIMFSGWGLVAAEDKDAGEIVAGYRRALLNVPRKAQVAHGIRYFKRLATQFTSVSSRV
ncbi:MAG: hypothetical protein ACM3TT_02660 [Syntrophothermus sp.]